MNVYLSANQAKQIVFQLSEIFPRGVSVTDEDGYIIASSDAGCIKQYSELARNCVEQTATDCPYNERLYEGNETASPLQFKEVCVGAILIKGDVERTKRLTSIAKAVGESIIYQPYLKDTNQVGDVFNFEFLLEWLNTPGEYSLSLVRRGLSYGIDITKPRCAVIVSGIWNMLSAQKAIEGILTQSNYYVCKNSQTIVLILAENYDKAMLREIFRLFEDVKFAIGKPDISLYHSYTTAMNTLFVGTRLRPEEDIYHFQDYELEYALSGIQKIDFLSGVHDLFELPAHEDLRQTLEVFFQVSGNQAEAINRLYIHRNTLKYRLDKIQELTTKNPRVFQDLFYLYVAYVLYKLQNAPPNNQETQEEKNHEKINRDHPDSRHAVFRSSDGLRQDCTLGKRTAGEPGDEQNGERSQSRD